VSKYSDQDIAIQKAVDEERERCARVCEELEARSERERRIYETRGHWASEAVRKCQVTAYQNAAAKIRGEEK
jgi:hypothetical protein